ncbi:MAG: HEAT repeat domain-containing protein [Treponema sp.]|nr:HEAT repeat domain-containing protein [Treponema sp.]
MKFEVLLIVLAVLIIVCLLLFSSVVVINLTQTYRGKKRSQYTEKIKPGFNKFFKLDGADFEKEQSGILENLAEITKEKLAQKTLEDLLLDILEEADSKTRTRALMLADYFRFPQKCLSQISDRLRSNAVVGCRKAGLYKNTNAIPLILKTLDILSSDTQYEALMALSRIGDVSALTQAFDKIHRLIFVNERAINEIINTFSGSGRELYRKMIHHDSDYLVRLFLKSADGEIANMLIDDIVLIAKYGNKETRLAGIIAIGRSGSRKQIPILINAMNDNEWEVRAMAAKTLGVLTSRNAVKALAKAARDREWWVRQNAVTSILAYPDCYEILASIISTGDRYAYDSMQYTIEQTNETGLLKKIRELWRALPPAPVAGPDMQKAAAPFKKSFPKAVMA